MEPFQIDLLNIAFGGGLVAGATVLFGISARWFKGPQGATGEDGAPPTDARIRNLIRKEMDMLLESKFFAERFGPCREVQTTPGEKVIINTSANPVTSSSGLKLDRCYKRVKRILETNGVKKDAVRVWCPKDHSLRAIPVNKRKTVKVGRMQVLDTVRDVNGYCHILEDKSGNIFTKFNLNTRARDRRGKK